MLSQIAQRGRQTFVLFWYFFSQPFWCSFEKHLNTGYNFRRSFGIKTFPQSGHFGTKVKLPGIELRHFTFALWFCCCMSHSLYCCDPAEILIKLKIVLAGSSIPALVSGDPMAISTTPPSPPYVIL